MEHEKGNIDYHYKFLQESFENLHREIQDLKKTSEKTLIQTTITNGRVTSLENWRATSQGYWSGASKTITIIASATGAILGILAAYLFRA